MLHYSEIELMTHMPYRHHPKYQQGIFGGVFKLHGSRELEKARLEALIAKAEFKKKPLLFLPFTRNNNRYNT